MLTFISTYSTEITTVLTAVSVISAIYFSFFNSKTYKSKTILLDRYDKVIFPLFEILEPCMLSASHTLTEDDFKIIISIFDSYPRLVGGRLNEYKIFLKNHNNSLDKKLLKKFIKQVDKEYSYLCNFLGIPSRAFMYRVNEYTFSYSKYVLLYAIWITMLSFIFLIVYLVLIFMTFQIINKSFETQTMPNLSEFLIIFSVIISTIYCMSAQKNQ